MGTLPRALVRLLGGLCAAATIATWAWLWVRPPWGELGVATPPAVLVTVLFGALAAGGLWAALRDVPAVLAVVGLVSLLPAGIYLLMAPGVMSLIGWCDLGMLVAGIALLKGKR